MEKRNTYYLGLDISDRSIEIAEISKQSGEIKLAKLERVLLSEGIVEHGVIKKDAELSKILLDLVKKFSSDKSLDINVVFGIPESQAYVKILNLENLRNKELDVAVREELERTIPIPGADIIFEYRKLRSSKDSQIILSVSVDKNVLQEWKDLFLSIGLSIKYFDIETLAAYRWLYYKKSNEAVALYDIGAVNNNLSVFTRYGLEYNSIYNFSGLNITKAIADEIGYSQIEAEDLKISVGLAGGIEKEAVISDINKKCVIKIIDYALEKIEEFNSINEEKVEKLILLGGTAKFKGLAEFLHEKYQSRNIELADNYFEDKEVGLYIEAIGLALRGVDNRWNQIDPTFINNDVSDRPDIKYKRLILDKYNSITIKFQEFYKKYKKIFWIVAILALVTIMVSAYLIFVRSNNLDDIAQDDVAGILNKNAKIIFFELPIISGDVMSKTEKNSGRLVEVSIPSGSGNENSEALKLAEGKLTNDEKIWDKPVVINKEASQIKYGYVAYNENEFEMLIKELLDKLTGMANSQVDDLEIKNIESGRSGVYIASGRVSIVLEGEKSIEKIVSADINAYKYEKIAVKRIGMTLNVRKGAGTGFEIEDKMEPGATALLLEDKGDWKKVLLNNGKEGWVYSNYVEIIK